MTPWSMDLDAVPTGEPVLFFLAEEVCGSRVHAGNKMNALNGSITIVGGYFARDMPMILAWRPMVALPGKEPS